MVLSVCYLLITIEQVIHLLYKTTEITWLPIMLSRIIHEVAIAFPCYPPNALQSLESIIIATHLYTARIAVSKCATRQV